LATKDWAGGHWGREAKILSHFQRENVVRLLSILWCAVLIGLMACGTFTTARIGGMTWGPAHDVWSAAIAISHIKFGLRGGLAYKEVEEAITKEVTAKNSLWDVMNDETKERLSDPAAINRGLKAGAAVPKKSIIIPASKGGYVTNWCEDLGYADFYNLAFRLFGINAYSTHYLYVCFLIFTFLLYVFIYFRDALALASLNLGVTALFLLSSTNIFYSALPSFATNRFLSTLGLIPLLYIIHTVMRRRPFERFELAILVTQIFILDFIIAARSSGKWAIIAVVAFAVAVLIWRCRRTGSMRDDLGRLKNLARRVLLVPYVRRIGVVLLLILTTTVGMGIARNALTDERYFWDDNLPHHLFWHSAYISLGLNPAWHDAKPLPELPDAGDGIGFRHFELLMQEKGLSAITTQEGAILRFYRARIYEPMIRDQYLTFIRLHPGFMFELFAYYKPVKFYVDIKGMIGSIGGANFLLAGISIVLAALLYASPTRLADFREIAAGFTLIWLCSLLPIAWAYPAPSVMGDQFWSLFLLILAITAYGLMFLVRRFLPQKVWDDSTITSAAVHL
jgi:hypothetical protein